MFKIHFFTKNSESEEVSLLLNYISELCTFFYLAISSLVVILRN